MPGNNVLEVKSSAIIQPTDQISTKIKNTYFNTSHFYDSSKIINYKKVNDDKNIYFKILNL